MGAAHEPTEKTRALVQERSGLGQTQEAIARCLRIDMKTLRKYYARELERGIDEANSEVAGAMFLSATGREIQTDGTIKRVPVNSTLAIWWSKTRMGWKEPPREDASGNDGGATIVIRGGIASVHHEPEGDT